MKVIPAIDIRGGKVVRLAQGRFSDETVYGDSPVDVAKRWEDCGAAMIHVVDLDGAREGASRNLGIVGEVARAVRVAVELGGGIRDEAAIAAALDAGVAKVVVGTKALDEGFLKAAVKRFGERVVVGIDASAGVVVTKGWVFRTQATALELARKVESLGVRTINYTDVSKDGMLGGPNIASLTELCGAVKTDVVLAGGISSIDDIRRLKALGLRSLAGVIVGKALYEGRLDLREAISLCKG